MASPDGEATDLGDTPIEPPTLQMPYSPVASPLAPLTPLPPCRFVRRGDSISRASTTMDPVSPTTFPRAGGPAAAENPFSPASSPDLPDTPPVAEVVPMVPAPPALPSEDGVVPYIWSAVQTASLRIDQGGVQRSALRCTRAKILPGDLNHPQSFLILRGGDGNRNRQIPLFGMRAMKIQASTNDSDEEPSFAEHCICIRGVPTHGVILAFPTAQDMDTWCDSLCRAGCIMRDLTTQVTINATIGEVRLVQPSALGRHRAHGDVLALKGTTDAEKQKQLMNEAYFLLMLNNHNIPRAYGLYDVKVLGAPGLGMLLDYKSGSDFSNWIPVGGFPEWVIKGMMVQVVEALVYLHGLLIVHRDIKPSNLFCERGNDGSVKVCVGDFGLAAHAEENEALSKRCGSPGFVAPEIFDEKFPEMIRSSPQAPNEQVLKIDVFSFGMTLYGAVLGVNPFIAPTLNRTYKNNARAEIPADDIARVSAELRDLLKWLTARNPRRRCSIGNAARHPWLQADLRALGFTGANEDMHGDNISWELFEEQSSRLRDLP